MGCGRESCYEDSRISDYQLRVNQLQEMDSKDLLRIFTAIKEDVKLLNKELTTGTRLQFIILDSIISRVNDLP